jgi:endonuclease YncB( thermonuclease family)
VKTQDQEQKLVIGRVGNGNMKKIIAILLLTLGTCAYAQKQPVMNCYDWKINRVVDGDTVEVATPWTPDPLPKKMSIRVYGVDTPEKGFRAKCPSEDQRGQAASAFTKKAITDSKTARVCIMDWDKYGGRMLGDVILDNNTSLRASLIKNGFAREYFGEAKGSWCN